MSATSSRSASRVSASSARRSSRRKLGSSLLPHRHCERSEAIQRSSGGDSLDCFVASLLAMTKQNFHFLDISYEAHLLPRLPFRPQGAHRRDRAWADRQDRV